MTVDPASSKLQAEHKHSAPLLCCAYAPNGRFLFAGGRDRGLVLMDTESNQLTLLEGHESWVSQLASAGSEVVLSADFVGRLIAWDCAGPQPKPKWSIPAHPSAILGLSVSADGKTFATGDREGCVRIWETASGKQLHEMPRAEFPIYGVALPPDGQRLITADRQPQKPRIKVWEVAANKELLAIEVPELSGYRRVEDIEWGGIRGLALSPDGQQIVACGRAGYDGQACALVYGTDDGKLQRKLSLALKGGFYYSAKFHPQGFLMTAGGDLAKGEVRFWNTQQDQSLADLATPSPCMGFDIHPAGQQFAVALLDGKAQVYEWGT
jgi:WD40 repeat protein